HQARGCVVGWQRDPARLGVALAAPVVVVDRAGLFRLGVGDGHVGRSGGHLGGGRGARGTHVLGVATRGCERGHERYGGHHRADGPEAGDGRGAGRRRGGPGGHAGSGGVAAERLRTAVSPPRYDATTSGWVSTSSATPWVTTRP